MQERIIESRHLLDEHWILGQGTIYPDTIESGGTAKAALIKTHHNRVAGIQKLHGSRADRRAAEVVLQGRSARDRPRARAARRTAGPASVPRARARDPLPVLRVRRARRGDAPRDAWCRCIRSACRAIRAATRRCWRSKRCDHDRATELINAIAGVNRVVAPVATRVPLVEMQVRASSLTAARLERLRRADAIVRRLTHESGFDREIWQFPVVLIPFGAGGCSGFGGAAAVDSVDGMTAQSVNMPVFLLDSMSSELLAIEGVSGVFFDLTNKPPATIEWE